MAFEANAKHIEGFALEPVGRGPYAGNAGHRLIFSGVSFDAQTRVVLEGIEIQYDVESLFALRPVHRREVRKECEFFNITRVFGNLLEERAIHYEDGLLAVFPGLADGLAEARFVTLHQVVIEGNRRERRRFRWRRSGRLRRRGSCRSGWLGRRRRLITGGGYRRLLVLRVVGHLSGVQRTARSLPA